jgi:hypothetical protein
MNFIRVLYNNSNQSVTIATTTNAGGSYTQAGATLTGFGGFASGDVIGAYVDQTGTVYVWKTAAATGNTTLLGSAVLPNNALWTTGGGRIGLHLPPTASTLAVPPGVGARIDDFAGGNVQ